MDLNVITCGDATLIGTVHVSPRSRDRVLSTIADEQPDVVAVELDPDRYTKMKNNPDRDSDLLDLLVAVLTGNLTAKGALVNYALLRSQKKYFDDIGFHAGEADMLPAVSAAQEQGSRAALIDDTGRNTVNNIGDSLPTDRTDLINRVLETDVVAALTAYATLRSIAMEYELDAISEPMDAIDVFETLPYDDLTALLDAYETLAPEGVFDHFLHERNEQMAGRIHWLRQQNESVVAVMGRAHVPGVRRLLENPAEIPDEYIHEPPFVADSTE